MFWPIEQAAEIMRWYRDFIAHRAGRLNGWFAFLNVPPGAAVPRAMALQKNVRASSGATPARWSTAEAAFAPIRAVLPAGDRLRRPDPVPGAAEHVRRALSAGLAVVLAGRLRQRAERRGDRACTSSMAAQLPTPLSHDAPLPDQRRGAAGSATHDTAFSYRDATGRR